MNKIEVGRGKSMGEARRFAPQNIPRPFFHSRFFSVHARLTKKKGTARPKSKHLPVSRRLKRPHCSLGVPR